MGIEGSLELLLKIRFAVCSAEANAFIVGADALCEQTPATCDMDITVSDQL